MIIKKLYRINEDVVNDLLNDEDTEVVADGEKSTIEEALDEALEASLMAGNSGNWQNVLFIGEAGTGKTAIVKKWAKDNGINLVDIKASTMDETDLGGAIAPGGKNNDEVKRLASTELDELDTVPNSVLFLDEFNRARKNVRGTLLTLIQDHTIPDARVPGKARFLKNFLFTIACINPNNAHFNTDDLDSAEKGRFRSVYVAAQPRLWLKWVQKDIDDKATAFKNKPEWVSKLNKRKALITHLVSHPDFKFDSEMDIDKSIDEGNGLALNPRSLTNLLYTSNGTKEDFLKKWNQFCNSLDYTMAERILKNYKDIDDKANDALNHKGGKGLTDNAEEEESTFKKKTDIFSKLVDQNPELADI